MKKKKHVLGKVIIPIRHSSHPEAHEVDTAQALAQHFCCDVEFLTPIDDYMRKTADIYMLGSEWEMKSPIGSSKSTIGNQFRTASKQAKNIIIDTRRTMLSFDEIEKQVLVEMKKRNSIKQVILIDKSKKVVAIKK